MAKCSAFLAVLAMTSFAHAAAAYGAGASASAAGDPPTGSPAGAVYELPFERGRAEAAPKGGGGTVAPGGGGGDGTGGGGGSDTGAAGGSGGESGTAPDGSGGGEGATAGESESGGEEGSLYRSENNFGSSSRVPGTAAAATGSGGAGAEAAANLAEGREAARVTDAGNTSPAANLALLGAIALIALGSGLLVRRAGGLRTQH
jgi:hypothetical protein